MHLPARPAALLVLLALCACASRREGDDADECRDGADNDWNGAFDCQDDGCSNSPDCRDNPILDSGPQQEDSEPTTDDSEPTTDDSEPATDDSEPATDDSEPTTDDSGDTGGAGGSCEDVGSPTGSGAPGKFKRADIQFTVDILPVAGSLAEDCVMVFKGQAQQFNVSTKRVEMCGTWALDSTTCVDEAVRSAKTAMWWDDGGEGYHTFTFTDTDVDTLDIWVVHKKQGDYSYGSKEKIYFFDLNAALNADLQVSHSEGGSISDSSGFYYGEVLFSLEIQFHTDA